MSSLREQKAPLVRNGVRGAGGSLESPADDARRKPPQWLLALLTALGILALTGIAAAVLIVVAATNAPGGSQAAVDVSAPDDPLTRWVLPVIRVLRDLASAGVIGILVLVAVAVPAGRDGMLAAGRRGVSVAAGLALAWVPLALVTSVLRLAVFAGLPTSSPALGAQYLDYLLRFPMGRSELAALVLTALVATVLPLVRTLTGVGGAALLAVAAVVPLAATGHASAGDFPESAVVTLAVHLVAAAVWVGGLLGVLLLQPQLGDVRAVVAARFSGLALVCWTAVAATGLINLALALHDVSDLASVWGAALITKVVLLLVLGVFGGWHRRRTLPQLAVLPSAFRRWAGAEAIVMAATLGVAVGVTVSAPPPEAAEDRQLLDVPWWLLGFPAPPPLTAASWFTAGRLDLLWAGVAVSLALAYLLGVRRLRRAAYAWAGRRTLTWLAGCVVLLYATSGAPGLYARVDYTASVTQVVLLALVAAPLLVAGRPWQLVELTVSPRTDGSRGLREWAAVAARPSSVQRLASLPAALALLVVLLVGMSLSPVAEATVRTWPAHTATVAVALGAGLLLFAALRASSGASGDQASARQRAGVMAVLAGVLAMLGASAAVRTEPVAADWYRQVASAAEPASLVGQLRGAAVVWGVAAAGCVVASAVARRRASGRIDLEVRPT